MGGDRCRSSRSRNSSDTPPGALRIIDINLRQQYYSHEIVEQSLQLANVIKLNDDELPVFSQMFGFAGSIQNQLELLANRFAAATAAGPSCSHGKCVVALTRGACGSLLYLPSDDRWSDCPSRPVEVVDTVGAGDSFTAALVLGLLHNLDLDEINFVANEVARYVCSQAGATPPMRAEFADKFRTLSSR